MENKNISTPNKPISRKSNIVVQEVDNEILIYDLDDNKAFCLNETSGIIWQMCDGTKTVAEISQSVSRKFNAEISEDFVWLALDQLKKDKLITNEFTSVFAGMSRREVIRKVGFASMVALPMVASIVAPTAVNAVSGCTRTNGQSCSTDGNCCEGLCVNATMTCGCICTTPGDCFAQSGCPNGNNCNLTLGLCVPG